MDFGMNMSDAKALAALAGKPAADATPMLGNVAALVGLGNLIRFLTGLGQGQLEPTQPAGVVQPMNTPQPVPEPVPAVSPVPEPEPQPTPTPVVVAPEPMPIVVEPDHQLDNAPEPVVEEELPQHMRFREPQPTPSPGSSSRELVWIPPTALEVPSPKASKKRRASEESNFDSYARPTMDTEEISEAVAPKTTFNLPKATAMSAFDCEMKIQEKEVQFHISLSRQAIAKRRKLWGSNNSLIAAKYLEIKQLQEEQETARQIDELQIWAETMRRMVAK